MKSTLWALLLGLTCTHANAFCITNSTKLDLTIHFSKDNVEWFELELKGGKEICYSEDLPTNTTLHFEVTALDKGWFSNDTIFYQFDADSESHLLYVLEDDKQYHMYTDG